MIRFCYVGWAKKGTQLQKMRLIDYLNGCKEYMNVKANKGFYGGAYMYDSPELGFKMYMLSTGVIAVDIDWIKKETAELIFNNFELLASYMPSLYAMQYSSSYYKIDKPKNGLHIFVRSKILNQWEYKYQATICLYYLAWIIEQVLEIDLPKEHPTEQVLDTHNTELSQRFFPSYSDYKYNNGAKEFDPTKLQEGIIEYLEDKYNISIKQEEPSDVKVINPINTNCKVGNGNVCKIKVDRNLNVGGYSGNTLRFMISVIADLLFGDKAKEFCDKNFYYEDGKSIYAEYKGDKKKYPNEIVLSWLKNSGYVEEEKNREVQTYLSEFHEDIIKEIESVNKSLIIAPTGTGKTYYINHTLAQVKNAVVITPFNVTNKLYDKCVMVNSLYRDDIPENKPIVMIWDQAIKYWGKIKDRFIIIDESHTLFTDRSYRKMAVELVIRLKEKKDKICFVTATPAGEDKWVDKVVRFTNKRTLINFDAKLVKNVDWAEYNYIKKAIENNWYDRIVLFDDMNAQKIYEKLVMDGFGSLISFIRANRKDTQDFINLRDNEVLEKKVTVCTCIAFNGLNFKNTNENILVVGSIQLGNTTSCQIIQQIGRIRNSKVTAKYFFNVMHYGIDIDDNILRTEERQNLVANGCFELNVDKKWLDKNYIEAMREIHDYYDEKSNIDAIIDDLAKTNYIIGNVIDDVPEDKFSQMGRAIKKYESDNMKEDILNDKYEDKEYKGEYDSKWEYKINRLISSAIYKGLDFGFVKNYVEKMRKNKLIESALNDIEMIIRAVSYTDDEILELNNRKDEWIGMLSNETDRLKLVEKIKTITKYNKRYKDKIWIEDNKIHFENVVLDIIRQEEERIIRESEQGKISGQIGGKISSPKKKCIVMDKFKHPEKYNLTIGQEFESCDCLSLHTGKSNKTISQWRNKGWIE